MSLKTNTSSLILNKIENKNEIRNDEIISNDHGCVSAMWPRSYAFYS